MNMIRTAFTVALMMILVNSNSDDSAPDSDDCWSLLYTLEPGLYKLSVYTNILSWKKV